MTTRVRPNIERNPVLRASTSLSDGEVAFIEQLLDKLMRGADVTHYARRKECASLRLKAQKMRVHIEEVREYQARKRESAA